MVNFYILIEPKVTLAFILYLTITRSAQGHS